MSLGEVVKNTLNHFKQTKEPITPDNYRHIFCIEAKKLNISVHECERIERALGKLDPALRKLANEYRVRTPDEALTFLVSQLNRAATGNKSEGMLAAALLIKRLLLIIEAFPLGELSKEARHSLGREMTHPAVLSDERNKWQEFQEALNFDYLNLLDSHGIFDKTHLPTLIEQVHSVLSAQEQPLNLAPVAELLLQTLRPTLAQANPERLKQLETELKKDAGLLTSQGMIDEIKELIEHRVLLDAELLGEQAGKLSDMVEEFKGDLTVQQELNDRLEKDGATLTEAFEKGEITEAVKEEFIKLAQNTRGAFVAFSQSIKGHIGKLGAFQEKIARLESELEQLRKEADEDYVTKVRNRRALNGVLEEFETAFETEGKDYSLIFLQIDRFEALMDTLGRDSGEVVLGTVARFVQQRVEEKNAILGRYGGNTFLCILPAKAAEAAELTKFIIALMPRKRFLYESRSFRVTLSGGIANRQGNSSLKDTLSHADACLRSAKLAGGNQMRERP
ncbi:MAG: GGDEF domain-containing protein [Campylobacterales bacterium]